MLPSQGISSFIQHMEWSTLSVPNELPASVEEEDMQMERAEEELEKRTKFLNGLIQKKKAAAEQQHHQRLNVHVRAADMPISLQHRAFHCARRHIDDPSSSSSSSPARGKLDSKRLALALKKEFDSSYGPAWHCIVGTSFGSYVTHSLGGFLYFSIDKVYVLLFRTALRPSDH